MNAVSSSNKIQLTSSQVIVTLLAAVAIALIRNLNIFANFDLAVFSLLSFWLDLIWSILLFVSGTFLAQCLFLLEDRLSTGIDQIGGLLAKHDNPDTDLPTSSTNPNFSSGKTPPSYLRQAIILWVLPLVGLYLVISSQQMLGLGFLFGLSSVYLADVLNYFQNKTTSTLPQQYFSANISPQIIQGTVIYYLIAWLVMVSGMLLW